MPYPLPNQRIAPVRISLGSRVIAPISGKRRCQGRSSSGAPEWRLIFQARYSIPPEKVALALFVRFWLTANPPLPDAVLAAARSEEHTSELQSLMRISYAVFCLKKNKHRIDYTRISTKSTKR